MSRAYLRRREIEEIERQEREAEAKKAHPPEEHKESDNAVLARIRVPDELERFVETDLDFTGEAGVSQRVAETMSKLAQDNLALRARAEAALFRQKHPEFVPSQRAFELIVALLQLNDLAPTCANFEWAWAELLSEGLLHTKGQQETQQRNTDDRVYSDAELDAMSADDFAKAVGLKRVGGTIGRTWNTPIPETRIRGRRR